MLYSPTEYQNNIIITRVRLARNISGYPFYIKDDQLSKEIVKKIYCSLRNQQDYNLLYLSKMNNIQMQSMKERHILSESLILNKAKSAIIIDKKETVSIMVHEEDVIREQCFLRGLKLFEAYQVINKIDDEISDNINFAYDKKLGYLTACPTNVGTGLRASVMLFLPALTSSGKIKEIISKTEELGFTFRGIYGEGSCSDGFMYQISNEVTLGVTEEEILNSVEEVVDAVCKAEKIEEKIFYKDKYFETQDKCLRAYGILSNCKILSYSEFIELISDVRIGVCLGMLKLENAEALNDLIVSSRPMNLRYLFQKNLCEDEINVLRADFIKKALVKVKGEAL